MPKYDKLVYAISDPGVAASAGQTYSGGPGNYVINISAAAASTVIALQGSMDGGTTFVNWNDRNGAAITVTANGAAATAHFYLGDCGETVFRLNTSAGGGATTTGTAWIQTGINIFNG